MTDNEAKTMRENCIADILSAMQQPVYYAKVASIDPRLSEYIYRCADRHANYANLYELLGIRKFLRMLCSYSFDYDKVQRIYRAYEHLKFSGMRGRTCYRLTPMQCFQLAAPFGFMREVTEERNGDGSAWVSRKRVCTEANYFVPRKSSKTTLAAFFNFWFFFFEDYNCKCFCVANAQKQSEILFDLTKDIIRQMDPEGKDIRFTATEITWRDHNIRESSVTALSAGGKTKDGLFAGLCCADEYGSAGYVKDHSDMANLINVVEGSMGPRREPMTVITTTAGRIQNGPYQIKLDGIKDTLLMEMTIPMDGQVHTTDNDWQFAQICQPDQWEQDDESLQRPEIWSKCNHHLGVTVQPDFYANEWKKMLLDPEKRKEQITKLFNVWQTDRVKTWLTNADIQPLQVPLRVTDLDANDGWVCFAGLDFSMGNDLNAISYLCYNTNTGKFFADTDVWIAEYYLDESANAPLYRMWRDQGYLHTCPGKTIDDDYITARMMEVAEHVTILRIGYDPYKNKMTTNNLKAWIFGEGQNPETILRPVKQTFATFTSPVQEMTIMIQDDEPMISFSQCSIWGWAFTNCMLQESTDGMGNMKPVKAGNYETCKIDPVICVLMGLILFDEMNSTVN